MNQRMKQENSKYYYIKRVVTVENQDAKRNIVSVIIRELYAQIYVNVKGAKIIKITRCNLKVRMRTNKKITNFIINNKNSNYNNRNFIECNRLEDLYNKLKNNKI